MRLNALFRLAFATAPPHGLTLPHTITRRLILQKARGHFTSARRLTALPRLVGTRFQVLFHDPSPGHFSLFAHHYSGNRGCFLFLWVLRCFTSPRYLHLPYVFRQGRWAITLHQVSPFGNPRIKVWLPTPRGLSQAPTSFIGSWCQGIHRAPLSTWRLQLMLASTVQFSRYGRPRPRTPASAEEGSRSREINPHGPFPQAPTACPPSP